MIGTRLQWATLAGVFVLVLLYATAKSIPAPVAPGEEFDSTLAEGECTRAVRGEIEDARFPFPSKVIQVRDERYWLQGTVDAGHGGETVRRNYECVIRRAAPGEYVAESVRLWQSH